MNFQVSALTDVGRRRPHNEDAFASLPELGLHVVCDGMGGHAAGEVASRLAIDTIVEFVTEHHAEFERLVTGTRADRKGALQLMATAIQEGNRRVKESAEENEEQRGMGTTATALLLFGERGIVGHVGDSRLYLRRGDRVHQVTTDHTILTEMIRAGRVKPDDEAKVRHLNALTRAVGVHPSVEVDTLEIDVLPGDVFLCCSDGLHGFLDALDLGTFLEHSLPESAARDLVEFANKSGGHDNITAIAVYAGAGGETEKTLRIRLTLDTLRRIPLFHYLTFGELLQVIPVCQARFVGEGDRLIEVGGSGDEFYIVVEGRVGVHSADTEIAQLGPGQYFGEMSLVDNRPRSASVTALDTSHLIAITRDDFYEILRADSVMAVKLLWNFIQTLSSLVRTQNTELAELSENHVSHHPYSPPKVDHADFSASSASVRVRAASEEPGGGASNSSGEEGEGLASASSDEDDAGSGDDAGSEDDEPLQDGPTEDDGA